MILLADKLINSGKTGEKPELRRDRLDNGSFAPGNSIGKLGGRPKGTRDKINKLRDQLLDYFLTYGPERLLNEVGKESKRDVLAALSKMMPRANEVEDITEERKPIIIIDATDI